MATLNIGQDFSIDPSGRFYTDGDGSGEEFREELLLPALKGLSVGEKLEIILDDEVEGYGSSFLVESFAGLVKYGYFQADELIPLLTFKHTDSDFSFYVKRIIDYIHAAKYNSVKYKRSDK